MTPMLSRRGALALGLTLPLFMGWNAAFARNSYLGAVATRCRIPTDLSPNIKQQMSRSGHIARQNLTDCQLVLPNFFVQSHTGLEMGSGGTATFKAWVEYPSGAYTPVTFSGADTGTAESATNLLSDAITVTIPEGQTFWIWIYRADERGALYFSYDGYYKNRTDFADAFAIGEGAPDRPDPRFADMAVNNLFTPAAIVAQTTRGSLLVIGDSLDAGAGDTPDKSGNVGIIDRWAGAEFGIINCARPSDTAQAFVQSSSLRRSLSRYASAAIVGYHVNDVGNKRTADQIKSDLMTIGALLAAENAQLKLFLRTAVPQVLAGNSRPLSSNGLRIEVNEWRRSVPPPYHACVEVADPVENGRNGGLFSQNNYSLDGTHLTSLGYKTVANSVASGLLTP